jgi:hypothetical protein
MCETAESSWNGSFRYRLNAKAQTVSTAEHSTISNVENDWKLERATRNAEEKRIPMGDPRKMERTQPENNFNTQPHARNQQPDCEHTTITV